MQVIVLAVLAGVGTGVLSGLVGIGGGVVLVPMLLYFFRTEMHTAAGTSLLVIIPTAIAGVLSHFSAGNVSFKLGLSVAPGAIVGAMLGAHLASLLPAESLKRVFAVIMLIMSIKILVDSFGGSAEDKAAAPDSTRIESASSAQETSDAG